MKVVKLLVLFVDCSSSSNIDEESGKDNDPKLMLVRRVHLFLFLAQRNLSDFHFLLRIGTYQTGP